MILSRARVAAALGAGLVLVAASPLPRLVQRAGDLGNLTMIPVLGVYLFGGILAGGLAGVWLYRRLDWGRRGSHQCLGLLVGLVFGVAVFGREGWPVVALAAGITGLIGVAAATIFWLLDLTVKGPVNRPYP
jgi:hypothetical protein